MPDKCGRCAGCGKIANTDEGEPWSYWMRLPVESAAAVVMGIVKPILCPQCGGSGWLTPEQVEIAQLKKTLTLARDVRRAQRAYFKSRDRDDLIASKQAEKALDEALKGVFGE